MPDHNFVSITVNRKLLENTPPSSTCNITRKDLDILCQALLHVSTLCLPQIITHEETSLVITLHTGNDQTWRVVNSGQLHVPLEMTWRAVLVVRVYKQDLDERTGLPPARNTDSTCSAYYIQCSLQVKA